MPTFIRPVGWKLNQFHSSRARPFASNSIDTARITFNYRIEMILCMQPIQFGMNESGIVELSATADKYFQSDSA